MSTDLNDPSFADLDPYAVLSVSNTATAAEIRSAYRKRALSTHPDKSPLAAREAAHQEFQRVALAYAVLSDDKRRERYDASGSTAESALDDDDFDWRSFFKEQYKAVSTDAVKRFKEEYQGSDEERQAVLNAYTEAGGSMDAVFEEVMVSNPLKDEERFREIIDAAITTGEVDDYEAYSKETKASRKRRMNTAKKEEQEAMQYAKELGVHDEIFGKTGEQKKAKRGVNKEADTSRLEALIKKRNAGRIDHLIDSLEVKYGGSSDKGRKSKRKMVAEPDEEEFLKVREKVDSRKSSGGTRSRSKRSKQLEG